MRIGLKLKNVKFYAPENLIFFDFSDSQNLNDLWVTDKKRKKIVTFKARLTMLEYPKSGVTDYPVVPNQTPSIKECLIAIAQGKPLPQGAVSTSLPVYNDKFINDYKVGDELYQLELNRRNLDRLTLELDTQNKAFRQQVQQSNVVNEANAATISGSSNSDVKQERNAD